MPEFDEPGLLAQLQDLHEQPGKRLQVALAEVRNGAEIRRIERGNDHEIDTLAAGLGDAAVHDQTFEGDETVDYAFMAQNPDAADNRWLR